MWRCAVVLLWATVMVQTSAAEELPESSLRKPEGPEMTKNDTVKRVEPAPSVRQVSSSSKVSSGVLVWYF